MVLNVNLFLFSWVDALISSIHPYQKIKLKQLQPNSLKKILKYKGWEL